MELADQFSMKLTHPDAEMELMPVLLNLEVIGTTPTQIDLQLNIENPQAISAIFLQPCFVELEMSTEAIEGRQLNASTTMPLQFDFELPRMLDKEFVEEAKSMSEKAANAGSFVCSLNILVSFTIGISLKSVWSVINILQLIVYATTEIKANLPAHS